MTLRSLRDVVWQWRLEIVIVLVGMALAAGTVASTSPTADEAKHIWNGFHLQRHGQSRADETPSARLHAALILPQLEAIERDPGASLWSGPEHASLWLLRRARLFTAVAFLALLVICALWAHALFPPRPARVVLALAATSPTLLAHASVATSDMFLTVAAFGCCHALFRYQREATTRRAIAIGVWAGLALLAKISGLFLYATIVLAFAWLARPTRRATSESAPLRTRAGRLALVTVVPLLLLHVGYGFRGTLHSLDRSAPRSPLLQDIAALGLGPVPLPVPAPFVHAIDYSLVDRVERRRAGVPAYMLGELHHGGRAAYFPFAFLVKTSGVILLFLGLAVWAARRHRAPNGVLLALGVFPCVFFAINVIANPFDVGVRYLLPIYPFVIMWGGFAMLRGCGARIAIPAALAQTLCTALAFPNYLASFNASSWFCPKHALLSDSNLDWGQMNHLVSADLEAHPTTGPVRLCTFGPVLELRDRAEYECPMTVLEGRLYLSTTVAHLGRFNAGPLLRIAPTRTLADVIHVYDVASEADVAVTFVNDWQVSAPFDAPAADEIVDWSSRAARLSFAPARTQFGLLDVGALHANAAMLDQCVLARSAHPVVGRVLLGADDTMVVYAGDTIVLRDPVRSGIDWPQHRVDVPRPTELRLLLCNHKGAFAAQAGVLPP